MVCICQECGNQFKVDILIDDEIWKRITPKPPEGDYDGLGGLLCGWCIIDKLESLGYGAFKLIEI